MPLTTVHRPNPEVLETLATSVVECVRREEIRPLEQDIHDSVHGSDHLANPHQTDGSRIPQYMRSLDAAETLRVPGWYLRTTEIRFMMWRSELWRGDKSVKLPPDVEAIADDRARAETAAWLRAAAHEIRRPRRSR